MNSHYELILASKYFGELHIMRKKHLHNERYGTQMKKKATDINKRDWIAVPTLEDLVMPRSHLTLQSAGCNLQSIQILVLFLHK